LVFKLLKLPLQALSGALTEALSAGLIATFESTNSYFKDSHLSNGGEAPLEAGRPLHKLVTIAHSGFS